MGCQTCGSASSVGTVTPTIIRKQSFAGLKLGHDLAARSPAKFMNDGFELFDSLVEVGSDPGTDKELTSSVEVGSDSGKGPSVATGSWIR